LFPLERLFNPSIKSTTQAIQKSCPIHETLCLNWTAIYKQDFSLGLPDNLKFFQGHFVSQRDTVGYFHGHPQERPVATWGIRGQCSSKFSIPQVLVS